MPHLTLHPDDPRIDVASTWAEKELVRQVPGARWDARRKTWHVPRTWPACIQLRSTFGDRLTMDDDVRRWATCEREHVERARALRSVLAWPEVAGRHHPDLYDFQVAGAEWLLSTDRGQGIRGLLADEMGVGKSATTLTALRYRHLHHGDALPAVVVCPNSVKRTWETEAARWFPEATPIVVEGGAAKRMKALATEDQTALFIINYEAVRLHSRMAPYGSIRLKRCTDCGGDDDTITAKACEVHPKQLNELPLRSVVLDEAHRIKGERTKQTRAVWATAHSPTVVNRIALTGTPIANHVADLWSIMHALALEEYPVRSTFLDRYGLLSWNAWGGMDIVGVRPDTKAELFGFLDPRFRRTLKRDVLTSLPPKVRTVRHAPLIPKMRKAYQTLEDELVTRLDDGTILFAPNQLAQSTRLLQLSSAYGTVQEDGTYLVSEPSPKLDVMEEILDEMEGHPVAVCAMSRQLIDLAAERLNKRGTSYGLITGAVSDRDRQTALHRFQDGQLEVLLFTIQAGGTGLTMTATDTLVFLQRSWSLVENRQAEDRVHRIGSEVHESVQLIDVVAPETVEEWQIEKVHEKLRRLEELTRDGTADDYDTMTGDDDLRTTTETRTAT